MHIPSGLLHSYNNPVFRWGDAALESELAKPGMRDESAGLPGREEQAGLPGERCWQVPTAREN